MDVLPVCFFPTEVVFVDDSEIYLQTLTLGLESHPFIRFKTFSTPNAALDYIHQKNVNTRIYGEPEDTFSPNCYALKLNIFSVHNQIYDAQRYQQISVVIADHDLGPQVMNGVEFCQSIQNPNIQKILFTGKSEQDFVIQAFNQGQIQQYVAKKDIKDIQDIVRVVEQAQRRYFLNYVADPLRSLIHRDQNFALAIESLAFKSYFDRFVQENHIVEYYLLDAVGSYLMVDKDHQAQLLMVQNEDQCQANDIEYGEEAAAAGVQEQLRNRQVLCYTPEFWDATQSQFEVQFLPALCVEDNALQTKFYCACINNPNWLHLDKAQWR